jgi:hypothetical protein
MKRQTAIFHASLYCFALIRLFGSLSALAQQTSSSETNGVINYVPKQKILGGQFSFQALLPVAGSSSDPSETSFQLDGSRHVDTLNSSLTTTWDWNQGSSWVAYSFTTPTGRYNPGGRWTNFTGPSIHSITSGTTVYLSKTDTTAASLSTDWEIQVQEPFVGGAKPGQYFTMEWGMTRLLALDDQKTKLVEFGAAGYDEWPVSGNVASCGLLPRNLPCSVHAVGFQTNLSLPEKGLSLGFKYEPDYGKHAQTQGPVITFSALWTW